MIFNNGKIKQITNYIFLEAKPQKADLAFVFGTMHQEPIDLAYDLYKNNFISKIIVSGGINKHIGGNEAKIISKELIKMGVKKEDIVLEDKSTNTLENVIFAKKVIDKKIGLNNIKKILVVVKSFHARRALMTLKKHFPKHIKFIPVIYNLDGFNKTNWFKSEIGKEKVLSEYAKIKEYLKKGDIEEL
jgi:uncharacterized SAM-binding protein YcdF (DUF218 family)